MVDLSGASIGGGLILDGAYLDGKDGPALTAQTLTVTGSMFCGGGFQAAEIYLTGASIGGQLDLNGAHPGGRQ
jgi:hypothetical protein